MNTRTQGHILSRLSETHTALNANSGGGDWIWRWSFHEGARVANQGFARPHCIWDRVLLQGDREPIWRIGICHPRYG